MTKKEQIINLLNLGITSSAEIAAIVRCDKRHVQNVKKNFFESQDNKVGLTVENYISAIQRGCDTKEKIAEYFVINRRTLLRFEKKNISRIQVSRYLFITGTDIKTISHLFRLTEEETEVLKSLPTIAQIKNQLKTISAVLHPLKANVEQIAEQHANVNDILWRL